MRNVLIATACLVAFVLIVLIELAIFRLEKKEEIRGRKKQSRIKMRSLRGDIDETQRPNKGIHWSRLWERNVRALRIADCRRKIRKGRTNQPDN